MFAHDRTTVNFFLIFFFISVNLSSVLCGLSTNLNLKEFNATTNSEQNNTDSRDVVLVKLSGLKPADSQWVPCPSGLDLLEDKYEDEDEDEDEESICYQLLRKPNNSSNNYQITVAALTIPHNSQQISCPPGLDVDGRTFNCYLLTRELENTSNIVNGLIAPFSQIFCRPGEIYQEGKCKQISDQ